MILRLMNDRTRKPIADVVEVTLRKLRRDGVPLRAALAEAACRRKCS